MRLPTPKYSNARKFGYATHLFAQQTRMAYVREHPLATEHNSDLRDELFDRRDLLFLRVVRCCLIFLYGFLRVVVVVAKAFGAFVCG